MSDDLIITKQLHAKLFLHLSEIAKEAGINIKNAYVADHLDTLAERILVKDLLKIWEQS